MSTLPKWYFRWRRQREGGGGEEEGGGDGGCGVHDAFHVVETKKVGVCFMDKEVGVCIFIGCRVLIFLLQWKGKKGITKMHKWILIQLFLLFTIT